MHKCTQTYSFFAFIFIFFPETFCTGFVKYIHILRMYNASVVMYVSLANILNTDIGSNRLYSFQITTNYVKKKSTSLLFSLAVSHFHKRRDKTRHYKLLSLHGLTAAVLVQGLVVVVVRWSSALAHLPLYTQRLFTM